MLADDAEAPRQRRAETKAGSSAATTPAPERIGRRVWWFGLVASVFVAGVLALDMYAYGLPHWLEPIPQVDKAFHFSVGGGVAFFLDGVLRRRMLRVGAIAVPAAAVLLLVPAGVEEYLQRYSSHRTSSWTDFAADVAGVAFCIWLSRRVA